MKILLINKWVAGATLGPFYYPGTWRDTFELACVLADLGHKVEILTAKVQQQHLKRFQKEFAAILAQKGIKHHFASTYISFGKGFGSFRLKMFFDELRVIRGSKPDIIQYMQFCPSLIYPFVKATPVVFYSCYFLDQHLKHKQSFSSNKKTQPDIADIWQEQGEFNLWAIFQNMLFTIISKLWGSVNLESSLRRGAIVISMHPKGYEKLKDMFGSKSKVYLVEKGIHEVNSQLDKKRKNGQVLVTFIGTTVSRKGILDLLKAIKIVQRKNSNVKLLIAGSGPSIALTKLKRQISTLRVNAEYLGPISFTKKWSILKKSDIFCLPSYLDAYPSVILEAMAVGLPVISTKEIDTPIVDGASGLLINAGDVESLAGAIEKLVNNSILRQKIGKAGKIAVQDLTWSNQAAKLISLYRKFLSA